jgi:hypothetical protein
MGRFEALPFGAWGGRDRNRSLPRHYASLQGLRWASASGQWPPTGLQLVRAPDDAAACVGSARKPRTAAAMGRTFG